MKKSFMALLMLCLAMFGAANAESTSAAYEKTIRIHDAWVNLRKQDSKASPSLAKINAGENVTVLVDACGPENGWVRVLYSLGEHHTLSQDELDTGRTTLTGYIWHSFLETIQ